MGNTRFCHYFYVVLIRGILYIKPQIEGSRLGIFVVVDGIDLWGKSMWRLTIKRRTDAVDEKSNFVGIEYKLFIKWNRMLFGPTGLSSDFLCHVHLHMYLIIVVSRDVEFFNDEGLVWKGTNTVLLKYCLVAKFRQWSKLSFVGSNVN